MRNIKWAWICIAGLTASAMYCVASALWFEEWLWLGIAVLIALVYMGVAFALPLLRHQHAAMKRARAMKSTETIFRPGTRMPDNTQGKILEFKSRKNKGPDERNH